MKPFTRRLLTSVVAIPVALAVVFFAPGDLAFPVFLAIFLLAATELLPLIRRVAPSAPLKGLMAVIPIASIAGFLMVRAGVDSVPSWWLWAALSLVVVIAATAPVLAGSEVRDAMAAMGIMAFAIPYFAVPPVSLYWLQTTDPWLLLALLGIIWMGDTGAFAVGGWIGRHQLAPAISPGKTWEGALGGFVASLLITAAWSLLRLGTLHLGLMAVATATAIVSQLGDLAESMLKRGAGVKDSSNLLPGHGGFFDRMDSTLLATPVFVAGVQILGPETLIPG